MIKKEFILNFLIIFFIFFLDRISKIYVLDIAQNNEIFDISINPFLNIILVWNSGIGFGGFELFMIVAIGVLAVLAVRSRNKPRF